MTIMKFIRQILYYLITCNISRIMNNSSDWLGLDTFLDVVPHQCLDTLASKNCAVGADLVNAFPGTILRRITCRLGF